MTRTIDADALIKTLNEKNIPVDVRVNYEIMNAPTIEPDGDTISRSRAIKDVSEWATDILHPDKLDKEDAIYILESLPLAPSADANDRLYIKVYADDEPSVMAEKLYQICGDIAELAEVARCIQGYCDIPPDRSRQRGEWHEDSKGYFYCDQCHKYPKYQEAKTDFCPSCGARMFKGGEDE